MSEYIGTNSDMKKVRNVWKCDLCGSTDISDYKGLGKKCNGCGRAEDIDDLESRNSKIRVIQIILDEAGDEMTDEEKEEFKRDRQQEEQEHNDLLSELEPGKGMY